MTKDVIALTPAMPDLSTLLAGLHAGGPGLGVGTLADGAVVQLCAPDGRPLVSVEAPILVQVPGEVSRLLGGPVPEGPVWWTEARASTAVAEAGRLAGSFAGRLATVLGGSVWPAEAASTEVVPLTGDVSAAPLPTGTAPAVDVLTDSTAVIIQDRPLVALTSWLADALRTAADSGRALHIVTPPGARLSLPARVALRGLPNRWVIQHPVHGYYDGLSGAVLHWRNGGFTPVRDDNGTAPVAAPFTAGIADTGERQLLLTLRTRHPADDDLVLGRAVETCFRDLTGVPPGGWSTAEPVNVPWSVREVTALARSRAPRSTLLTVVSGPGRPAIATVRVLRTPVGVEEDTTLAVGYDGGEEPPWERIEPLASRLAAEHGLLTLLVCLRAGRRDLTVPARLEAPPVPVSFTLGGREVAHHRLGDGTGGRAAQAWEQFRGLVRAAR
ncbi:DUF6177 family protein [Streptomyces anandii]|uniref:DUF6177 family protein n=1 Tax=Streptomyces anandii TaxID=285454 RepID=UPI0036F4E59E